MRPVRLPHRTPRQRQQSGSVAARHESRTPAGSPVTPRLKPSSASLSRGRQRLARTLLPWAGRRPMADGEAEEGRGEQRQADAGDGRMHYWCLLVT